MDTDRLYQLFNRYLEQIATPEEEKELMRGIADAEYAEDIKKWIGEHWETYQWKNELNAEESEQLYANIQKASQPEPKLVQLHTWKKIAIAASIILVVGLGSYLAFFNKEIKPEIVKVPSQEERFKNDVQPGTNVPQLVLADGRIVRLDSAVSGSLAVEGSVNVKRNERGEIIYEASTKGVGLEGAMRYNTINNPRGSKVVSLALSDGSKVWLNAGSSLIYPVVFIGSERKVSITGEAYFEVSKNETMPFIVSKGEMEVTVLGTHFNVNAYEDEASLKVTLLEGSVKVSSGNANELLKPGQQSQLNSDGQLSIIKEANIDEIMAWKDGFFHFESADLKTILRQFSRWYDVEVIYDGPVKNRKFFAIVKRSSTLKSVLEMLKDNNIVYQIEGKKLVVRSG